MADPRTIIVAVDLQSDWSNLVAHAARYAANMDAALHLVHVVAKPSWLTWRVLDSSTLEPHMEHQIQVATDRLAQGAQAVSGVAITYEVRTGKPAVEIVECVVDKDAAMVAVGGTPNAGGFFVGTVADRVLRHSPAPVLVVGPESPRDTKTILVPTSLGSGGRISIDAAGNFSAAKRIIALHVIAIPSLLRSYSGDVVGLRKRLIEEGTSELHKHLKEVKVPSNKSLEAMLRANEENTNVAQTILTLARERNVDLIVMALNSHRSPFVLGRTAEKLVRALPCSLLALPDSWLQAKRDAE